MGYQRGERGRLASLITVIILGTAVVSIDHISGRSVGPPARSEAANQVISMELATASPALNAGETDPARSNGCPESTPASRRQRGLAAAAAGTACQEPIINSIKLKARELQDTDWPILARLSGITKKPSFLELQTASIPPLRNRLIAASARTSCSDPPIQSIKPKVRELQDTDCPILARISGITRKPASLEFQVASITPTEKGRAVAPTQISLIKNVSIRIDGEVRISKIPAASAHSRMYFTKVVCSDANSSERSVRPVPCLVPAPAQAAWKSSRRTS
jgi:hypothetical protein